MSFWGWKISSGTLPGVTLSGLVGPWQWHTLVPETGQGSVDLPRKQLRSHIPPGADCAGVSFCTNSWRSGSHGVLSSAQQPGPLGDCMRNLTGTGSQADCPLSDQDSCWKRWLLKRTQNLPLGIPRGFIQELAGSKLSSMIVAHICNPNNPETESGGLLEVWVQARVWNLHPQPWNK